MTEKNLSFDNAYITWVTDDKPSWTLYSGGLAADTRVEIGARPIPEEPMVCSFLLVHLQCSNIDVIVVHHYGLRNLI